MRLSRSERYAADLAERAIASFLEGALASTPITFGVADLHDPAALSWTMLAGGLTGVLALVKGLLARAVGDRNTAALLGRRADTPKPDEDTPEPKFPPDPPETWAATHPADPALAAETEIHEIPVGRHPVPGTGGPATVKHPHPRPRP